MVVDFMKRPIAAAIRTEKDFSTARVRMWIWYFCLHSNIMTVNQCVKEIHSAGKKAFIHVDFAEGIGKDRSGLEFLAKQGVDGILTTRTNIVKMAKDFDLITVRRFFYGRFPFRGNLCRVHQNFQAGHYRNYAGDYYQKIREFSEKVDMPIIAGGIVETDGRGKSRS